ncbi:hypothetical protein NA57DRAFT_78595 [Rhizodiscina lignyota]|uniref:ferric-chelate reductase (NADPH) n=1 Tax=Rhizodiscina lignyota TaxID=1504668 RepID=A0A9P4M5Z6_9PEZI|nr:hypothetical protein NA57DRAFT_78595 [Rhizodiscina lignyota]
MDGMDMSGMDMSGMGMDSTSQGMFEPTNSHIAKIYWSLIGAGIGVGFIANVCRKVISQQRKWQQRAYPSSFPARPCSYLLRTYATLTALWREISYPQGFYIKNKWFAWLTPPPLGRSLILIAYIVTLIAMTFTNSVIHDAYYFERVGFRAAWMSVMQVPFIVLLGGKVSLIGLVVGSSYERINWLHRWVARVLLITVTVHASFFLAEWARADFVSLELEMMPMVKYGMAAGGTLLFMNLTGLAPIRRLAYEIFFLLHLASIGAFLWLLYKHVPSYAMQYVWLAISFVALDRTVRTLWLIWTNSVGSIHAPRRLRFGYTAELTAFSGGIAHVSIKDIPFRWHPGAHIYLWFPRIGYIESHPFTISNNHNYVSDTSKTVNTAELTIRSHSGFTSRLHKFASRHARRGQAATARVFVQGPFGSNVSWNTFDTVILISASTGTSFTLPILDSIINDRCCVRRLEFLLLVRTKSHCNCYLFHLRKLASIARSKGLEAHIRIAITRDSGEDDAIADAPPVELTAPCCALHAEGKTCDCAQHDHKNVEASKHSMDDDSLTDEDEKHDAEGLAFCYSRPDMDNVIRPPVEAARGETCIVVCGGKALTSHVRNYVACLSDERAVHKGTGAQGLFLHTEEFGM